MITLAKIQENLSKSIKESGLTQTELANRLGIKQPTIGQYISGRAMPALDTFANLCQTLDVNPADILCVNVADNAPVSDRQINEVAQIMYDLPIELKSYIVGYAKEMKSNHEQSKRLEKNTKYN